MKFKNIGQVQLIRIESIYGLAQTKVMIYQKCMIFATASQPFYLALYKICSKSKLFGAYQTIKYAGRLIFTLVN